MATSQQIHFVIAAVESGDIADASNEQLAQYAAWLSHPTSLGYCSAQQYQQVCETVRFYLGQTMDNKQTINVTGSSNFQIGDGNTQTINQGIAMLLERIENSSGTTVEKGGGKVVVAPFAGTSPGRSDCG